MPSFMRLVYPSPLGRVHTCALRLYRRCFMAEEGHSRSIRIDLLAAAPAPAADTILRSSFAPVAEGASEG